MSQGAGFSSLKAQFEKEAERKGIPYGVRDQSGSTSTVPSATRDAGASYSYSAQYGSGRTPANSQDASSVVYRPAGGVSMGPGPTGIGQINTRRRSLTIGQPQTLAESASTSDLRLKWEAHLKKSIDSNATSYGTRGGSVASSVGPLPTPSSVARDRTRSTMEGDISADEVAHGVLCKMKCRLYVLQRNPVRWIDAGGGLLSFRLDENTNRVVLTMAEKKSARELMNHSVHPRIELKENPASQRSWIWTTTDYAHMGPDGKPTIQTFAVKFKHQDAFLLFKQKYDSFRDRNGEGEASRTQSATSNASLKPAPVDAAAEPDSPPPPPPAHVESVPPAAPSAPPPSAPATNADAAAVPKSDPPARPASAKNMDAAAAAIAAAASSASTRRTQGFLDSVSREELDKVTKTVTSPGHSKRGSQGSSGGGMFGGAKAKTPGALTKSRSGRLKKFFGDAVPQQVLQDQDEMQYEPTNEYAASFPRNEALRYVRRTCAPSVFVNTPVSANMSAQTAESNTTIFKKVRQLVGLDIFILQAMIRKLQEENATLQAMAGKTESKLSNDAPPPPPSAPPVQKLTGNLALRELNHLHELVRCNNFYHREEVSIKLGVENLRRSQQFRDDKKRRQMQQKPELPAGAPRPQVIQYLLNPLEAPCYTNLRDPPRLENKVDSLSFNVEKVNKIRKNKPRELHINLRQAMLTIKKPQGAGDDVLDRDIEIKPDDLITVEPSPSNSQLLSFSFYVAVDHETVHVGTRALNLFDSDHSKAQKVWKILFRDKEERERFYRLMQIHMAGSNMLSHANETRDQSVSTTYMPTPVRVTPKVKVSVRMLQQPVQKLARELHETWMLQHLEDSWKFGPDINESSKTHHCLVPFELLPPAIRSHYTSIVTQIIASAITIRFKVEKRIEPEQDEDDEKPLRLAQASQQPITRELRQLVNFLAQNSHDTWAEQKMSEGWGPGNRLDTQNRVDPMLIPFEELPEYAKATERNCAYKVLGSLIEWGYTIQKEESAAL